MASATDYQLAAMKVNLTKLENTVIAFKQTVILQQEFIKRIPVPEPMISQNQTIIPYDLTMKSRMLTNTKANLDNAEHTGIPSPTNKRSPTSHKTSWHQRNQIRLPRTKICLFHPMRLLGTYRGIMTNQKYNKLKAQLDTHTGLVNRIVNVVNNQGKALDLINQDLVQIKHQLSFEALLNSLNSESSFQSTHFQLSTEIARIKNALQCAQWRRLSLDFLSSKQLDSLYQTMVTESQQAETELLVSQPSDLLQLELSNFYNGEMVTLLLQVPTVPIGSLL